ERLLDLGAGRVRQLRRLVSRLLEQTAPLRLGLSKLLGRVPVRIREELTGFIASVVQQLCALPLALLPVALDLALPLLPLAAAAFRQVFQPRERGERRLLSGFLCGHAI